MPENENGTDMGLGNNIYLYYLIFNRLASANEILKIDLFFYYTVRETT
jgi:hypothetical protein